MNETQHEITEKSEEKSFFSVIVHSFFIIPFLIAVFCLLLFTSIHLLTQEKKTAYDYLEDIKIGGLTKRWQGAFELSKILANQKLIPTDAQFSSELIAAFNKSTHDDPRVRQYLALAMGRTQNPIFLKPLAEALEDEKEENLTYLIYAIGMLKQKESAPSLYPYIDHPQALVRSVTTVSLGNIANSESKVILKKGLLDSEPNVQWGAAISLAQLGDESGKNILLNLLDRKYLTKFSEVDLEEQDNLILAAIEAATYLEDMELSQHIKQLSSSDQNMKVRAAAVAMIQQE